MIKETIIPLPPIAEQRRIVAAIEAAFEQLDTIAEKQGKNIYFGDKIIESRMSGLRAAL
jgi:restriction endonuclease S subunit